MAEIVLLFLLAVVHECSVFLVAKLFSRWHSFNNLQAPEKFVEVWEWFCFKFGVF